MGDLTWLAPTILAISTLVGVVANFIITLRQSARVAVINAKVDEVKKATDGMLHAAVADAAEKGRAEGAAIATAGAAAGKP